METIELREEQAQRCLDEMLFWKLIALQHPWKRYRRLGRRLTAAYREAYRDWSWKKKLIDAPEKDRWLADPNYSETAAKKAKERPDVVEAAEEFVNREKNRTDEWEKMFSNLISGQIKVILAISKKKREKTILGKDPADAHCHRRWKQEIDMFEKGLERLMYEHGEGVLYKVPKIRAGDKAGAGYRRNDVGGGGVE